MLREDVADPTGFGVRVVDDQDHLLGLVVLPLDRPRPNALGAVESPTNAAMFSSDVGPPE